MEKNEAINKVDIVATLFLVAGTCIGGGMLGLPVGSCMAGFIPSTVMLLVCWFFMTISGLLILEVNLWMKEGAHVITMASKMLGFPGKILAWILYLFIGYASLVAYLSGGGSLIAGFIEHNTGFLFSEAQGCVIFILLFGSIIYFGSCVVGRVNTVLFTAMIIAYLFLVGLGGAEIQLDFLFRQNWRNSMMTVPLLLTAFSFQTLVPSLTPSLKRNVKWLRFSIIGGTTIALLVYLIWQAIVLGAVPFDGEYSLKEAYIEGKPATSYLHHAVGNHWLSSIAEYFSFFALVTSFLGIALGLFDFLSDGLKVRKKGWGNFILGMLIALPSLFFAVSYSRAFLVAMEISGGFGDAILNGMMPVLMVWVGRYYRGMNSEKPVFGGKALLLMVFTFYLFVFVLEIFEQIRGLPIQSVD